MSNVTTTNIDLGNVILDSATHRDKLLTFLAAATLAAGTILAVKSVADAVTVSAITGTGNGTVTAATVADGGIVPKAGAYILRNKAVVTNGGVFVLIDPDGNQVAGALTMTVGAGAATTFNAGGLQFTITDGSTDFALNDQFTLTVAAISGKVVAYDPAGTGGAQIASDVLTYEVTATGAGDIPIRSMIDGRVRKERLLIAPATAVTEVAIEQLRLHGIVAVEVQQLSKYDNAAS